MYSFSIFLCSCEKEEKETILTNSLNSNEFAALFSDYAFGVDQPGLNNNTSVFFYSNGMDNITMIAMDFKGTI
tara:strand:+ start:680 stop:898 length:219 start_codon:yes stop_codon:yes gene_type:complete